MSSFTASISASHCALLCGPNLTLSKWSGVNSHGVFCGHLKWRAIFLYITARSTVLASPNACLVCGLKRRPLPPLHINNMGQFSQSWEAHFSWSLDIYLPLWGLDLLLLSVTQIYNDADGDLWHGIDGVNHSLPPSVKLCISTSCS